MLRPTAFTALGATLLAGANAFAAEPASDLAAEVAALKAIVQNQQTEISQLRGQNGENWLNERRAEEVKALVREVLNDADTRASLQGDALSAGYDRGFFIATDDGNFQLKINLTSQTRYIYNDRDDESSADQEEFGFTQRRTQLNLQGHVFDPRWTYRVRLAADADGGAVRTDWAYIGYQLTDRVGLQVGQLKVPFLREEIIGADRQLAVERSYTADYFTIDFTQGLVVNYWQDRLNLTAGVHDGSYAWRTEFNNDRTNLAVAGRAEYVLIGDPALYRQKGWRQLGDFTSFAGEPTAVLLGAAVDYEHGEEGRTSHTPDIFKYTFDVQAEFGGFNAFAAFIGQHLDANDDGGEGGIPTEATSADQFGIVVQGGFFVVPDKVELFGRYEYLNFDGVYYRNDQGGVQTNSRNLEDDDELNIITAGVNYYVQRNNIKATVDVLYALGPVPVSNAGGGLLASPDEGQVAVRAQLTLSF